MGHDVSGVLASWTDVEAEAAWGSILLGNGFSLHLWPGFNYSSLFTRACDAGQLDRTDQDLFAAFRTENFERVLSALSTSVAVADALDDPTDHLFDHYTSVQQALGGAVRAVHPQLEQVPRTTREHVRAVLRTYGRVFTTSYDLLLYWSSGAGENGVESFEGFKDFFWSNGSLLEFDPLDADINEDWSTRVYYLHGALHLAVNGAGITRKKSRGVWSLLDQFGLPEPADPTSRPLLISEGEALDKLRAIQENDYLRFALRQLRRCKKPLVVFGHSLGDQDKHLVDALNREPGRPVAVSIVDRGQLANRARQAEIRRVLSADELLFYDAGSHPLGNVSYRLVKKAA